MWMVRIKEGNNPIVAQFHLGLFTNHTLLDIVGPYGLPRDNSSTSMTNECKIACMLLSCNHSFLLWFSTFHLKY